MDAEKKVGLRIEVIECLAGWSVHRQFLLSEDWKKYRIAISAGVSVDSWRAIIKDDIAALRKARRVLKEF